MDATNFTREQLAEYILSTAKDSVISKFKDILSREEKEEIVAYTVKGEPLTQKKYLEEVLKGKKAIEEGKYKTSGELRNIIDSWGK